MARKSGHAAVYHVLALMLCTQSVFSHGRMNYKDTDPYNVCRLSFKIDLLTEFAAFV